MAQLDRVAVIVIDFCRPTASRPSRRPQIVTGPSFALLSGPIESSTSNSTDFVHPAPRKRRPFQPCLSVAAYASNPKSRSAFCLDRTRDAVRFEHRVADSSGCDTVPHGVNLGDVPDKTIDQPVVDELAGIDYNQIGRQPDLLQ